MKLLGNINGTEKHNSGKFLMQFRRNGKTAFVEQGYLIKEGFTTPFASHNHILYQQRRRFTNMYTTVTCLECIIHPPEHMLGCGHSICDRCVVGNDVGAFPIVLDVLLSSVRFSSNE